MLYGSTCTWYNIVHVVTIKWARSSFTFTILLLYLSYHNIIYMYMYATWIHVLLGLCPTQYFISSHVLGVQCAVAVGRSVVLHVTLKVN